MEETSRLDRISLRARALEASRIREIAERGMRMPGAVALWFGEGAWPTPAPIVEAAIASLRAGNHMYQPNNGARALREEICAYTNRLYGSALTPERVTVTQSGTQGLALAAQLLVSPGDRIVAIEPGWPNIAGAFRLAGGTVSSVALAPKNGRWALDLEALLDQLTPGTRAVVLNSPQQSDRLDHAGRGAEGPAGALPGARHLDRDRRLLRPALPPRPGRALVSGDRRSGGPADLGQQLLQVLVDDRVGGWAGWWRLRRWRRRSDSSPSSTPRARRASYRRPAPRRCATARIPSPSS